MTEEVSFILNIPQRGHSHKGTLFVVENTGLIPRNMGLF